MEAKSGQRQKKKVAKYNRLVQKYNRTHEKHQTLADVYKQDPNFRVVREGLLQSEEQLKKKVAELEKIDEQLMATVARTADMEVLIQTKDEELQLGA